MHTFTDKQLTQYTDGECISGGMSTSKKWWGHTDITGVLPRIRHLKWVESKAKSSTSSWCHTSIRTNPCNGDAGGQSPIHSNKAITGKGVGLANNERGSGRRSDGGLNCNSGYCRQGVAGVQAKYKINDVPMVWVTEHISIKDNPFIKSKHLPIFQTFLSARKPDT